jgi:hypothetical protein
LGLILVDDRLMLVFLPRALGEAIFGLLAGQSRRGLHFIGQEIRIIAHGWPELIAYNC